MQRITLEGDLHEIKAYRVDYYDNFCGIWV